MSIVVGVSEVSRRSAKRLSVGYWAVEEVLKETPGIKWRQRDDLMAEVAEVGDTVYVKPMVHIVEHNAVPLVRVKEFLGLRSSKVTVMHYDAELPVGQYSSSFGGRTKNNAALKMAAAALREEGFGRLGLGVADGEGDEDRFQGLFTLGFRGVQLEHMDQWWLANRLREESFDVIRQDIIRRVARDLTGNARAGSIYDPTHRL